MIDLKQTNFIERLVEDTLANEGGEAPAFASQQQPKEEESDSQSQFSHMNESIDQSQTTTATEEPISKPEKVVKKYETSSQQQQYIAMQKEKFDVDKLKQEKE